jgi:hypothetical protein
MGLGHHYPTDGRTRNYRTALLLYRHADSNGKKIVALFKSGGKRSIPPYQETRNYVRKIRRLYTKLRHPI